MVTAPTCWALKLEGAGAQGALGTEGKEWQASRAQLDKALQVSSAYMKTTSTWDLDLLQIVPWQACPSPVLQSGREKDLQEKPF